MHVALFGNVTMLRGWCPRCEATALVQQGRFLCCDTVADADPTAVKRVVSPEMVRRSLSPKERQAVLKEQNHRCAYCFRPFGSFYWRDGKPKRLQIHWDHVVPYSWSQDNNARNFVAACHVCNSLKGDKLFQTFDEARIYLQQRWVEKYDNPVEEESA